MVRIGDVIAVPFYEKDGFHGVRREIKAWTVTAIYQHFVVAVSGHERECFTHNELIQLGYERQADRYEAMRMERDRHWSAGKSVDNYKRKYEDEEEWE